jgi:hypothetical protein
MPTSKRSRSVRARGRASFRAVSVSGRCDAIGTSRESPPGQGSRWESNPQPSLVNDNPQSTAPMGQGATKGSALPLSYGCHEVCWTRCARLTVGCVCLPPSWKSQDAMGAPPRGHRACRERSPDQGSRWESNPLLHTKTRTLDLRPRRGEGRPRVPPDLPPRGARHDREERSAMEPRLPYGDVSTVAAPGPGVGGGSLLARAGWIAGRRDAMLASLDRVHGPGHGQPEGVEPSSPA